MDENKGTARDNVQISETKTDLIIRIQKDRDFGLSASGKTRVIASTGGFVTRDDGLMINLNVVKKP